MLPGRLGGAADGADVAAVRAGRTSIRDCRDRCPPGIRSTRSRFCRGRGRFRVRQRHCRGEGRGDGTRNRLGRRPRSSPCLNLLSLESEISEILGY